MELQSRKDLIKYFAEMLVVVLGILIAFQVEELRQERQETRDLEAALVRLSEETKENQQQCERIGRLYPFITSSVQHVFMSLDAGEILNDDIRKFENGLKASKWLPAFPWSTTVPGELIATGLLKELEDSELRDLIAQVPGRTEYVKLMLTFGREAILQLAIESNSYLNLSYDGPTIDSDDIQGLANPIQDNLTVDYDFEILIANTRLKNLFYDVVDAQYDVYGLYQQQCENFDRIQVRLVQGLEKTK